MNEISGSLEDVSVEEVLQFIHLGRRTGTLELRRGAEVVLLAIHQGRILGARTPGAPRVGDLLVEAGILESDALAAALDEHARRGGEGSPGEVLVERGAIDAQALSNAVLRQIERSLAEVLAWERGSFEFIVGDLRPVDDLLLRPSELPAQGELSPEAVMLEAARIFDARSRLTRERTVPPDEVSLGSILEGREIATSLEALDDTSPRSAADLLELHVVTHDKDLAERLAQALAGDFARVERVHLSRAGEAALGGPPPVVLLDLRPGGPTPELVDALHHARPRASLVAIADANARLGRIYAAGALAAVPPEVEAVQACLATVIESRSDLVRGPRTDLDRLRRVMGDLRSGVMSATVALSLMHVVSESVERAVLFLVRGAELMALGAFGTNAAGRHLASATRSLRLDLASSGSLSRAVAEGRVVAASFADAGLPATFRDVIGPPRNGQIVVFPVLGAQGTISVVYTDNGAREELVEDIEILELATAQVGIAFENELLRRRMGDT